MHEIIAPKNTAEKNSRFYTLQKIIAPAYAAEKLVFV